MHIIPYDRAAAVKYARDWALSRNPAYYNFDNIGGDCTNFISQCIYAGIHQMNYTKDLGWYYRNGNDKAPAWTGVNFLYRFLTTNQGIGPFGIQTELENLELGDIIQISFDNVTFAHSTILTRIMQDSFGNPHYFVCAHTYDVLDKNINAYAWQTLRCIHIVNGRA